MRVGVLTVGLVAVVVMVTHGMLLSLLGRSTVRFEPVLVDVDKQLIVRFFVAIPEIALPETDQVERLAGQAVFGVGQLFGVAEGTVVVLDPAGLATHVERRADVAGRVREAHPDSIAGLEASGHLVHGSPQRSSSSATLRSISSRVRMPFSISSVSSE